jgi:hypothetical protein
MKNRNPNVVLCFQSIRRNEYGSDRDVIHIASQRRVSVIERLAGTVDNRAGYGMSTTPEEGLRIAAKQGTAYREMLDAGHKELFDYEIGRSFEIDNLVSNYGGHCSPSINVSGDLGELNWCHKVINKIASTVEKNRSKERVKAGSEVMYMRWQDLQREAGSWSLEIHDKVIEALNSMGAVEIERYKSATIQHFEHLVAVKR